VYSSEKLNVFDLISGHIKYLRSVHFS